MGTDDSPKHKRRVFAKPKRKSLRVGEPDGPVPVPATIEPLRPVHAEPFPLPPAAALETEIELDDLLDDLDFESEESSEIEVASEPSEPSEPNEPKPGWVLDGRYRLEEIIGEGGMAVVWRAEHLRLEQSVAVKFLRGGNVKLRKRFLREAKVAAAIQHRHVVQILDFGTWGESAFMVMEHLVGGTLADRLIENPIPAEEALRLTAEILGGLTAVHDAGMAHRDIKPENIFLVEDADGTYSKLVDFGLSKRVGSTRDEKLRSVIPTAENLITGTPEYMSPEQARGLHDVDERTDTWSTGVMVFEMLTGEFPYSANAVGDLLFKIISEDPPSVSTHRPDLGAHIDDFVARAIVRDREKRYPNARAMRQALLVAVNKTASEMYEEGKRAEAKLLLRSVSSAYEPGDSGLVFAPVFDLDFSDVRDTGHAFADPTHSARQRRDRPDKFMPPAVEVPLASLEFAVADVLSATELAEAAVEATVEVETAAAPAAEAPETRRVGGILWGTLLLVAGAGIGAFFLADMVQPRSTRTVPLPETSAVGAAEQAEAEAEAEAEAAEADSEAAEAAAAVVAAEQLLEQALLEQAHLEREAAEQAAFGEGGEPPVEGEEQFAEVRLESVPPSAQIYLDDVEVDNPLSVPRDDEPHQIVVRRVGFEEWSTSITADGDETIRVSWRRVPAPD